MKKGGMAIMIACALAITTILGYFLGRNANSHYALLPVNYDIVIELPTDRQIDTRIDINTASKGLLMSLPGIGDKTADRIIDYRTRNGGFSSIDELLNVEGIGEKKFEQIRLEIRAGG